MAKYSLETFITDSIKRFYSKLSDKIKHLDALEPELNEVALKFFCLEVSQDIAPKIIEIDFLPVGDFTE